MMKKYSIILLLFLFSCQGGCYSDFYQIKEVTKLDNGICEYVAWGIGQRFVWTELSIITFQDSCKVYDLSQIMLRSELEKNYGFNCKK